MEYTKFATRRDPYWSGLKEILKLGFTELDYIHYNPAFAGHMNISRYLALYEAYKRTLGLAGHIAEVGVYKAASMLYFAKLIQIFEPESLTLVHGFDWFQGIKHGNGDDESLPRVQRMVEQDACGPVDYERICKLVSLQNLDHIAYIHRLDVTKELDQFFREYPHLQFKLVFMDAGAYEVVRACLPRFWPRLVSGGVMIFDQFNHEIAPGETRAVREYLPDNVPIKSFTFATMPSAYVVKP
ncbi:class I SAM-dependent methyltransferase [Nitrospira sp. Nam80]